MLLAARALPAKPKGDAVNDIVIFETDSQKVEVRLEGDNLWLSLQQLVDLFGWDKSVISRHLKNIFDTNELDRNRTVAKNATVQREGGREVVRQVEYFNLDAIISVGYRVNSTQATRFRQWATRVLREHLTQGYSFNEHRLALQGLDELTRAVDLLGKTLTRQELVTDIGREPYVAPAAQLLRRQTPRSRRQLLIAEGNPKGRI